MKLFFPVCKIGRDENAFCPIFFFMTMAAALMLLAPVSIWASRLALLLENENGQTLLAVPLAEGEQFAIRYRHSVAQTPVTDYFVIKNGEIWLDHTIYHDFGAGLPHTPEHGQTMRQKHGELILNGFNRRLPVFELRVGRVAGHRLLLYDKKDGRSIVQDIALDQLAPPGSAITFSAGQINS